MGNAEYMHQWRVRNKEHISEYNKRYAQEHKEEIKKRMALYPKTKRGKEVIAGIAKRRKESGYHTKWHLKHKEAQNARSRRWRANNKERHNEIIKRWKQKNRIKVNGYQQQRRIHKLGLTNDDKKLFQRVYEDNIKKYGTLTCVLCGERIVFGNDSIEHLTPLSRGGKHIYENLGVAHKQCNFVKNRKTMEEWRIFLCQN